VARDLPSGIYGPKRQILSDFRHLPGALAACHAGGRILAQGRQTVKSARTGGTLPPANNLIGVTSNLISVTSNFCHPKALAEQPSQSTHSARSKGGA
jgi:hypothetical protein